MPFDIAGARAAGATDDDIKEFFRDRIDVDGALTAGSTLEEISEFLDKQQAPVTEAVAPPVTEPIAAEPPVDEPIFPAAEPPDLGLQAPPALSLGVAEEPVVSDESFLQPTAPPSLEEAPVVEPTFEAPASTTAVEITPPEPIVTEVEEIRQAPEEEVSFPELKALALGTASVFSQFLESAGTASRRRESISQQSKRFIRDLEKFGIDKLPKKKEFDELSIEEMREKLQETTQEKLAKGIRNIFPQEWKKEVSKQEIGADKSVIENTRAITTATASTLPRIATQWGLTAIPVVGPVVALGANMVLENGSMLETSDAMSEKLKADVIAKKGSLSEEDEKMLLQFQNRMEELSPIFGILSGTVEFSGNAFGALAKEGKKKLIRKVLTTAAKKGKKSKIIRELLGFMGEGAEEVIQGGLKNVFIHKAIKDVRDKNKGKEFAPDIKTGTTAEDFLGGVKAKEFITGAGVSALTRGLVKGARGVAGGREIEGGEIEAGVVPEGPPVVPEEPATIPLAEEVAPEPTVAEQLQLTPEQIERLTPEQRREFGVPETIELTPPVAVEEGIQEGVPLTPEEEVVVQEELDEELAEEQFADLSDPAQDKIEEISNKVAAPIVVGKESTLKDVALQDIADEIKQADPKITDEQALNIANVTSKHRISRLPSEPHINTELKKLNDEKQEDEVIVHAFLDLNKFKRINDTFGQAGGDAVMVSTQQIMNDEAEKQGIKHFHKGGDEGVMLIKVKKEDLGKVMDGLKAVKERIRDEANIELPDGSGTIPIGMSMGVSLENLEAADELLKKKVPNSIVFSDDIKVQLGIEDIVDQDVGPIYDEAGLADARGKNGDRRTEKEGVEDGEAAEIEARAEVSDADKGQEVQRPTPSVSGVEGREQPTAVSEFEREEVIATFRATRPQEGIGLLKEDSFTKIEEGKQAKKLKNDKGPDFAVVQTLENEDIVESVATATKIVGDFQIDVEFDTTPTGKPIGTGAFSIKPTKPNGGFKSQRETVFRFGDNDKIFNAAEKTIEKHLAKTKPAPKKKVAPKPKIAKVSQKAAIVEAPLITSKEALQVPVKEVRLIAKDAGLFGDDLKNAIKSNTKKLQLLSGYVNHFGTWMPVTAELVNNVDEQAKEQKKLAQDKIARFKELGFKKNDELIEANDVNKIHGDTGNLGSTGKDLFNNIKEELDRLKGISDRYRRQLARRLGTEGVEGLTEKETSQLSIDDDVLENDNFRETVPLDFGKKEAAKVKGLKPKRVIVREVVLDAVANKDLTAHDAKGNEVKGEVPKAKFGSSRGIVPPPIKPPAPPVAEKPDDDGKKRDKLAASATKKIEQNKKDVIKSAKKETTAIIDKLGKAFISNEFPIARRLAKTEVGRKALRLFQLSRGSNASTKQYVEQAKRNVIKDLTRREQVLLEDLLYTNRVVEVDAIIKKRLEKVKLTKQDIARNPFAEGIDDPDKVFMERKIANPRGLTAEESQAFIDKIKETEPEVFEKVNDRMNIWWDTMRAQITTLKDEGMLSKDFADFLIENHRHYSPRLFVQHMDPAGGRGFEDGGISAKPVNITDSGVKALGKGSEENALVTDTEYMLMNVISRTQARVFKNRANKALKEYVKEFPDNDMGMKIESKFKVDERGDVIKEAPAVPDGFIRLKVWENGEASGLLVPEEFASSWAANDPQATNNFMTLLKWMSGVPFLKAMATGLNPEFAITNLPRDIAYTLLKQHRSYSPFVPLGLAQIANDMRKVSKDAAIVGPLTSLYAENGGGMDMLTTQGRISKARVGPLKGVIKGKKIPGLAGVEDALDIVQDVMGVAGNFTERWTRIALMRRVLDKSLPGKGAVMKRLNAMPKGEKKQDIIDRAVYTARTNLDFAQGGTLTKSLDNLFPYLNASIQGTRGLFQAFGSEQLIAGNKGEAIKSFGKASAVAAQMMGLAFGMAYYGFVDSSPSDDDDEETKKIKQEKRDRIASVSPRDKAGNWIFHTPWKIFDRSGDVRFPYMRVSKDQGQRMFSAIGEALAAKVAFAQGYTSEDVDFDQLQMALEDAMVVIPGKSLPPVLDAWLAYSQNRDLWRKTDVWKGQMTIDPKFEQYHDTPKIFTALGEKINASPVRMEAALGKLVPHNLWTDMLISIPKGLELLDSETKKQGDKDIFETISGQGGKSRGVPGIRKVMRLTFPARLEKQKGKLDIAKRVIASGVKIGREVNGEFKEFSTKKVFKLVEEAEKNFNNVKQQNNMKLSGLMADHRQSLDDLTNKLVSNEKGGLEDLRKSPAMQEIISFIGTPIKEAVLIGNKFKKEERKPTKEEIAKINFLKKEGNRLKTRFKTRQKIMIENKKLRLETGSGDLFRLIDIELRARKRAYQDSVVFIESEIEE